MSDAILLGKATVVKRITGIVLAALLTMGAGAAAFISLSHPDQKVVADDDPRLQPPFVRVVPASPVAGATSSYTGVIAARVQSDLGFRVAGKITERLADIGQQVTAGQPLMRIDDTDLRLALEARRNAVDAAEAAVVQARADERRYADGVARGWASRQRYEQARALLDTATARLSAAKADAEVAENAVTYSTLVADMDGTVIDAPGEQGQVVSAGQTVVTLAQSGPREAVVSLPETIRPRIGSEAGAALYGSEDHRYPAHLRQLSDSADAGSRTYEARYVLEGEAADAPLGATVVIRLTREVTIPEVEVPLGAILDDGQNTGVWTLDGDRSAVDFRSVKLVRVTSEAAVISGLAPGEEVVALGVHLLSQGAQVRMFPEGAAIR